MKIINSIRDLLRKKRFLLYLIVGLTAFIFFSFFTAQWNGFVKFAAVVIFVILYFRYGIKLLYDNFHGIR